MSGKRPYENFMCFGARMYGMKNLWEPSREYKGQAMQRPNYLAGFLVKKTQPHWSQEPMLASLWGALQKIHAAAMSGMDYNMVSWPVRDGDISSDPQQQPADWARGHWMFSGNSENPIKVEMSQGSNLVPLQARANLVKPGDFVIVGGAASNNSNNPRAAKLFINNVVFTGPGDEIAVGNSVTGAELMDAARQQGYQPAGFNPAPSGGFAPNGGQGGFNPGGGGGFTPGGGSGFAPTQGGNASPGAAAGQPSTGQPGSGFVSPSNGQQPNGAPQGGFNPGGGAPNGGSFNPGGGAPQGGSFPQR